MSVFSSVARIAKNQGFNIALTGYFGYDAYHEAKKEGRSTASAVASAGYNMALPFVIPGGFAGYLGFEMLTSAPGLAVDAYRGIQSYRRKIGKEQTHRAFQTAAFQENQQTYTMRQAAMAIAERTRYNREQVMFQGREAKYMYK